MTMKNIHVLPTSQPSRLHEYGSYSSLGLSKEYLQWKIAKNIYISSNEEIKEGNYYINTLDEVVRKNNTVNHSYHKKIILTTDQDLIKNGVQAIDDEFLEWFVENPKCEFVETLYGLLAEYSDIVFYEIIIPKEEPKQETLEELVRPILKHLCNNYHPHVTLIINPTKFELLEGLKTSGYIDDYVRD